MATIKPTLSIVSNSTSHTTPGPISMSLNLSTSKDITIVGVKSEQLTVSDSAATFLTDALDQGAVTAGDTAGTHGCFLYIKNTSAADYDVSFGFLASATDPTAAEVYGAGSLGTRLGTLKQGEFMFMPYDYAGDLTIDAEHAAATIEYMIFSRT